MIYTTLNRILEHKPSDELWSKLLGHLGKTKADDEKLGFDVILECNGAKDALWCLRAEPQHSKIWRKFAIWNARAVWLLMADTRSVAAIHAAERYVDGLASENELAEALASANDAVAPRLIADGRNTRRGTVRLVASLAARATVHPDAHIAAMSAAHECVWIATYEADNALSKAGFDYDDRRADQYPRIEEMAWDRMLQSVRKMVTAHEAEPSCCAVTVGGTD
jgi:hypothetical protein